MGNNGIIVPLWDFNKSGGTKVLSRLVNYFSDMGNKVKIIVYYKTEKPYYSINVPIEYINENGEITQRADQIECENRIEAITDVKNRISALKKGLNKNSEEYSCVIANFHLTAYAVDKCKIKNKFYYIQAYEAWYEPGIYNSVKNFVAKHTYSMDMVKIVNADLYKNYKEIKSDHVVPPGIDLDIYYRKPPENYWDNKRPFVIGHIGRTEWWKGSEEVTEAVKSLQDEGINIVYKVAFNPPEEGKCIFELVKPHGDNNLAEYYRSVDVVIAPGRIQLGAIHYPVIESMACGTPVITTGYYPATDENSYIVGVQSPKEIAEAVKSIMSDYSLAMRKVEKANHDIDAFSWKNVSKKMLGIIEENIVE